jgi:phospholipid transport system transporter-binding protein
MSTPKPCGQRGLSGARGIVPIDGKTAFLSCPAGTAGVYRLEDALTFATVPILRQPGLDLIASAPGDVQFDLECVPLTDSAGLALLIDWLAEARSRQRTLRYLRVPDALSELAKLSDVESLIMPSADTAPVEAQREQIPPATLFNATTAAPHSP